MEDQYSKDLMNILTRETILVVDDNEINRAILCHIFSPSYHVDEAENGAQALNRLSCGRERYSAVLLDVVMPVMDGLTVLAEMNRQGWTSEVPVFLITAEAADATLRQAYAFGVMDVITKPVVPYIVERRINSVVELFRARRRLRGMVQEQRRELSRQEEEITRLNMGMVETLTTAIEFRSGESGSHVRRIHDITRHILEHTPLGQGFSKDEIEQIARASITHDVGKIAIPDAILNKPGRLTPEEFEIMKTHTIQGGFLLERIPQMRERKIFHYAYDIALHHHERWDGRGYPHGLKGKEISVWAQVVSIADVYDALVSPRVYKKAVPADQALQMIRNGECGVFNPYLVDAFLSVENGLRSIYKEESL